MFLIIFIAAMLHLSFGKETANLTCDLNNIFNDEWGELFPNDENIGSCSMSVHENSTEEFKFKIHTENANFIHLRINFTHNGPMSIQSRPCIIEPYNWIWTFYGDGGARQYLNWPMEYSVWSLGLLDAQTVGPINITLIVTGNCSVYMGTKNTTARIGLALRSMLKALDIKGIQEYFMQSYFCYKERIALTGYLYSLCNTITCPVEAIGYKCCHSYWCHEKAGYILSCPGKAFQYDILWWVIPFVAGFICYLYVPIILFKTAELLKFGISQHRTLDKIKIRLSTKYQSMGSINDDTNPLFDSTKDIKIQGLIFESPVSVGAIISRPFRHCFMKYPVCSSRVVRFIFSFMTMSIIVFKVLMHGLFQRDFIIDSVKRGVPMDFLSVYAGYELSRYNFLRCFGGPYIACCLHLFLLTVCLCVPKDLSSFYEKGLPNNPNVSTSALNLDITTKLRFGSTSGYLSTKGYRRIYKTMIIHFIMLLNSSFWKHAVKIQRDRWRGILTFVSDIKLYLIIFYIFVFPLYVFVCMVELLLCIVYYGFPVLFWIHIVLRAYVRPIWQRFCTSGSGFLVTCAGIVCAVLQSLVILFIMYMFNIVFVDSFVFISRLIVFTYTGLFAYPAISFSYVIFGFSVIMYGMDSIKATGRVYRDLFDRTKCLSKKVEDENPRSQIKIWIMYKGYSAIPQELFQFVLDRHRPIRIEVFLSMLKIFVLICTIYISVSLLQSFKTTHRLHTLIEAVSTLFVCFIPKLLKEICVFKHSRKDREFDWALEETIKDFRIMKHQSLTQQEEQELGEQNCPPSDLQSDQSREDMSLLDHL